MSENLEDDNEELKKDIDVKGKINEQQQQLYKIRK